MSMAHSLEVRPMLLDHKLAEYLYALPARLKTGENQNKRIFIESTSQYIPKELQVREKMGFELPFVEWMSNDLKPLFLDLLNSNDARLLFSKSYLKSLNKSLKSNNPPRSLWAWGILLSWCENHSVELL